jgi:hypothetical protein
MSLKIKFISNHPKLAFQKQAVLLRVEWTQKEGAE